MFSIVLYLPDDLRSTHLSVSCCQNVIQNMSLFLAVLIFITYQWILDSQSYFFALPGLSKSNTARLNRPLSPSDSPQNPNKIQDAPSGSSCFKRLLRPLARCWIAGEDQTRFLNRASKSNRLPCLAHCFCSLLHSPMSHFWELPLVRYARKPIRLLAQPDTLSLWAVGGSLHVAELHA